MSLEELFCDVDDFCRVFLPTWHRQLLTHGDRKRQRASRLTLSEIMTILIYFHQSQYRNFKAFYLLYLGSKILYATLKGKNSETKSDEPQYGAIFNRALILSLTNPKAILFYVSFFVQFIDVNAPHTGISFFILATTLELVSFCYLSFLIISGAFVTQYIRTKKKLAKVGNSLIGLMFVGFAARLATLQS